MNFHTWNGQRFPSMKKTRIKLLTQRPEFRVQRPEFSVQGPASRFHHPESNVQHLRPESKNSGML